MARGSLEQEIAGRQISAGLFAWLGAEVLSSDREGNAFLSNYEENRRRIVLPYEDLENWTAAKNRRHLDRLPVWREGFEEKPLDDYQSARLLFAALMFVSGANRNQSMIQAQSADDYMKRRARVVGVPIKKIVVERLNGTLPRSQIL